MKLRDLFDILLILGLLYLFLFGSPQNYRADKATVIVESVGDAESPEIQVYLPPLAFYNGGDDNQVYLFRQYEGSEEWKFDVVINGGWTLAGGVIGTKFLLVCAPRTLPEDQILDYVWMRYHPQNWYVEWTGSDTPGDVTVWCE